MAKAERKTRCTLVLNHPGKQKSKKNTAEKTKHNSKELLKVEWG
jgi:hypothetical protein